MRQLIHVSLVTSLFKIPRASWLDFANYYVHFYIYSNIFCGSCLHLLIANLPIEPAAVGGEQGRMRGEQGIDSMSLMLSSADEVSDRRDRSGGARLADMVRTRGEPQCSSEPLSTVWADFYNEKKKRKKDENKKRKNSEFLFLFVLCSFKPQTNIFYQDINFQQTFMPKYGNCEQSEIQLQAAMRKPNSSAEQVEEEAFVSLAFQKKEKQKTQTGPHRKWFALTSLCYWWLFVSR